MILSNDNIDNIDNINICKYYKLIKSLNKNLDEVKKDNIFKRIVKKFRKKNVGVEVIIVPKDLGDLEECIICLGSFVKDNITLSCDHKYHKECIKEWIKEKDDCPLCRKILNSLDYYKLTSKWSRIKYKIYEPIRSSLEFIISVPTCLLSDIVGYTMKLGFEIIIIIFSLLNMIFCCENPNLMQLHRDMWEGNKLFQLTRRYLTYFSCDTIRKIFGIRIPFPQTIKVYNEFYNSLRPTLNPILEEEGY